MANSSTLSAERDNIYRTIVVIDMVGYSSAARLLEEHANATAVAELNAQIQEFIRAGLAVVTIDYAHSVVATTGDGAILIFESAASAHRFAEEVQRKSADHNKARTLQGAMRWFRVGMATGSVNRTQRPGRRDDFAGIAIANAVRFETAASPGQIVLDDPTWKALPPELQARYGREQTVAGKRTERFRVRKCQVIPPPPPNHWITRRVLVRTAAATASLLTAGAWLNWPVIALRLHPLPPRRFVALMAWPAAAGENAAIVTSVLDSIGNRLARAEAYEKDFLVIASNDLGRSQVRAARPTEAASALGANLVLAASLSSSRSAVSLLLQVLGADSGRVLRNVEISCELSAISSLSSRGSEMAAMLLGVPVTEPLLSDQDELAGVPSAPYLAFSQAKNLIGQFNNSNLDAAIASFQQALADRPQFALAYAELSMAYTRKYVATRENPALTLAAHNSESSLHYNPHSARGLLSQALVSLYSGRTEEALVGIGNSLRADPRNPETLLYKAHVFRDLGRLQDEEQVYRDVLRDRPNYWPAYNELGHILSRQGKYKAAAEAFEIASTLAPKSALPLANLGVMYLEMGKRRDAIDKSTLSLQRAPSELAYITLGDIAFQDADYSRALDNYARARDLNPKYHMSWRNIGDCYQMLGQPSRVRESYGRAAEVLADVLRTNPNSGSGWMTLAFYHARIGDRVAAESDFANAEAHGGNDIGSLFTKAQALAVLGQKEEALALILNCIDRGLSQVELDLALDLDAIRADPRYRLRLAKRAQGIKPAG